MGGFCNEVRCIMKKENNSAHNHNRGSFSGRIGYVLAVAGSAVGLGNIWRFPYLAAKYGGGIFLLIYILLTASFGYVLIMSETALGRMTRKSPGVEPAALLKLIPARLALSGKGIILFCHRSLKLL